MTDYFPSRLCTEQEVVGSNFMLKHLLIGSLIGLVTKTIMIKVSLAS